jgi:hypothetical protein
MKVVERCLPSDFADLEVWVEGWALPTEGERYDKREASSFVEVQSFYDAIVPRAEAATAYLDKLPLDALPPDAKKLMYLLFSLATIAFAVEVWKQPKTPDTGSAKLHSIGEPLPI